MSSRGIQSHIATLGMSQAQLARHFGLSAVTVSRLAHGRTPIPGPTRRWLELALAVTGATHAIPAKVRHLNSKYSPDGPLWITKLTILARITVEAGLSVFASARNISPMPGSMTRFFSML